MVTLLPCPFDGAPAAVQTEAPQAGHRSGRLRAWCPRCQVSTPWFDTEGWTPKRGHFSTRKQAQVSAAAHWNRRSPA